MTQAELGEKVGLSQAIINQYERGTKVPNVYAMIAFAETFNCSLDELCGTKTGDDLIKFESFDERRLFELYRSLNANFKNNILKIAETNRRIQEEESKSFDKRYQSTYKKLFYQKTCRYKIKFVLPAKSGNLHIFSIYFV